jgi:SAM-dependent methyltransferase
VKALLVAFIVSVLIGVELWAPTNSTVSVATDDGPRSDACSSDEQSALFRPEDLLLLEGPDRAVWQKPEQIMDELQIAEGSVVADIGAGSGWFTIRLAQRVQQRGIVYAQDVQNEMLVAIKRRVSREGLANVRTVLGHGTSPMLPANALDAVLVVDVYSEVDDRVTLLRNLKEALKPKGLIGIVNYKPGAGGPGPCGERRFPRSVVERDAREANLVVVSTMDLRYEYVVVLRR